MHPQKRKELSLLRKMPVLVRSEVEAKELYASMRPKLTFVLEERKVPYEVIVQIASVVALVRSLEV